MRVISLIAALAVAVLCGGCKDAQKRHEQGAKGVVEFHELYNAGKYAEIFAAADAGFGRSITLPEFQQFLSAQHDRLGKVIRSTESGWGASSQSGKTFAVSMEEGLQVSGGSDKDFVTLSQKTTFEKGEAAETFIFVMQNGHALLYDYRVESPDLIEK
ncbi:hypothetical protein DB345_02230 [Spartobacteria bacterium LR76]|nr:hypothetical protein DB345_02230 [Spartobacteria bacterium LR76]